MEGSECTLTVYSEYAASDDPIGGPEITGSVVGYTNARIEGVPVEMLLLNQGIETGQLYMATCDTSTVRILNNFIVKVNWPPGHFLWGVLLRVIGVTRTSSYGSFSHYELLLRHVDESH